MNIDLLKLKTALSDDIAVQFVLKLRLINYRFLPKNNFKIVSKHFKNNLKTLKQGLISPLKFNNALTNIIQENGRLYKEPWFYGFEYEYRNQKLVDIELQDISKYIIGKKILDFGCGSGEISNVLSQQNKKVTLIDITDHRTDPNKKLNFIKSYDSSIIPLDDKSIDTSLVFSVLHHNNSTIIKKLILELKRITKKRIIIKEDIYNIDMIQNKEKLKNDVFLQEFCTLSLKSQLNVIILSDFISNLIIQNNTQIDFPFNFFDDISWRKLFSEFDLQLKLVYLDGMRRDESDYYGSCHIYYIIDVL
ncbi:MAG: methyltransferase domain-containing protein [bacterium]